MAGLTAASVYFSGGCGSRAQRVASETLGQCRDVVDVPRHPLDRAELVQTQLHGHSLGGRSGTVVEVVLGV